MELGRVVGAAEAALRSDLDRIWQELAHETTVQYLSEHGVDGIGALLEHRPTDVFDLGATGAGLRAVRGPRPCPLLASGGTNVKAAPKIPVKVGYLALLFGRSRVKKSTIMRTSPEWTSLGASS